MTETNTAGFRAGAGEGFRAFLPFSVGLIPWALVVGMAMGMTSLVSLAPGESDRSGRAA